MNETSERPDNEIRLAADSDRVRWWRDRPWTLVDGIWIQLAECSDGLSAPMPSGSQQGHRRPPWEREGVPSR